MGGKTRLICLGIVMVVILSGLWVVSLSRSAITGSLSAPYDVERQMAEMLELHLYERRENTALTGAVLDMIIPMQVFVTQPEYFAADQVTAGAFAPGTLYVIETPLAGYVGLVYAEGYYVAYINRYSDAFWSGQDGGVVSEDTLVLGSMRVITEHQLALTAVIATQGASYLMAENGWGEIYILPLSGAAGYETPYPAAAFVAVEEAANQGLSVRPATRVPFTYDALFLYEASLISAYEASALEQALGMVCFIGIVLGSMVIYWKSGKYRIG